MELKHLVLKRELIDPAVVYSDTYADSQPSERLARQQCSAVVEELDKNSINCAAFDGNYYFSIYVSKSDLEVAKKVANECGLTYWSQYKYWGTN